MGDSSDGGEDEMSWEYNSRKGRVRRRSEQNSSQDEEGNDQSKKSKKHDACAVNGNNEEKDLKVIVTFKEEGNFNLIKAAKLIEQKIGKFKYAKYLSNKRLIIFVKDEKQLDRMLNTKVLNGERISTHVPGNAAKLRGVIYDIPQDITMEVVMKEVRGGKVVKATRLQTKRNGVKEDSLSVLLEFEGEMPKKVIMGYFRFDVREFIPAPLRCFKCQRMGHTVLQCKGKMRCAKCGGEHEYGKCVEGTKIRCCNCGGEHSAAFGGCPVQQQAREAQKYKVLNQVSYADALKKVKGDEIKRQRELPIFRREREHVTSQISCSSSTSQQQKEMDTNVKKINEDTFNVDKISFITFMCKIVNVALQQTRKSDRIKTVVDAAVEILGFKDPNITAELIHEMLEPNGHKQVD